MRRAISHPLTVSSLAVALLVALLAWTTAAALGAARALGETERRLDAASRLIDDLRDRLEQRLSEISRRDEEPTR